MAVRDTWRRALEYFGLVEGDYIDDGEYTDEHGITGEHGGSEEPVRASLREPVEPATRTRSTRGRSRRADADDIFADDDPPVRRRRSEPDPFDGGSADSGRGGNGGNAGDLSMHLVTPRSFNDAQSVADEFKRRKPVILNLQTTDRELSKRLIDFCSGLTYALGGGMQRVADRIFLLTPENVEVSAEEKARLLERGFFNQS